MSSWGTGTEAASEAATEGALDRGRSTLTYELSDTCIHGELCDPVVDVRGAGVCAAPSCAASLAGVIQ